MTSQVELLKPSNSLTPSHKPSSPVRKQPDNLPNKTPMFPSIKAEAKALISSSLAAPPGSPPPPSPQHNSNLQQRAEKIASRVRSAREQYERFRFQRLQQLLEAERIARDLRERLLDERRRRHDEQRRREEERRAAVEERRKLHEESEKVGLSLIIDQLENFLMISFNFYSVIYFYLYKHFSFNAYFLLFFCF